MLRNIVYADWTEKHWDNYENLMFRLCDWAWDMGYRLSRWFEIRAENSYNRRFQ